MYRRHASILAPMLVASLFFLALAGGGAVAEPDASVSPYELPLPGTGPEHSVSVRILGFEDGRLVPVSGARVTGWSEEAADADAATTRCLVEATSDEYGFAELAWPPDAEAPFHWLAEAPGKAVRTFQPSADDVFLARGAPYELLVLTPLGAPLPGAHVEYYIYGCPHSPAARSGTTGADGRVVFPGLPDPLDENPDAHNEWGQFWIVAEGVAARRHYAPPRTYDGSPAVILTDVGRSVSGSVHDENGRPRAGIVVRGNGYPRGPATITAADGRFRLSGLSGEDGIAFYDPTDLLPEQPNARVSDFESDMPIRLTFRHSQSSAPTEDEPDDEVTAEVRRRLPGVDGAEPAADVPVRLVRKMDGLTFVGETASSDPGLFTEFVPPGRYRVTVGGGFSSVVRGQEEVDLPRNAPVRFVLSPASRLVLRGLDPEDAEWVGLRTPFGSETATDLDGGALHLPSDVPAVIHLERAGPLILPVGPAREGKREATVPEPNPVLVRLRIRSADPDRPLEHTDTSWADDRAGLEDAEADDEGGWLLSTWWRGRRRIAVRAKGFQEAIIEVKLQPEDRAVDLGDVLLQPLRVRTLRILDIEGSPVPDLSLCWGVRGELGNELQGDDLTFTLELGPRSDPAVLRGEGIYPLPVRLSSEGPAEVRLPGGRLVVRVRDVEGRDVKSVVYVDHVWVAGEKGDHVLRGVPPGTHTVIAGAPGHMGAVCTVEVQEGEPRIVELTLPRR